jgi:hypothetical protein
MLVRRFHARNNAHEPILRPLHFQLQHCHSRAVAQSVFVNNFKIEHGFKQHFVVHSCSYSAGVARGRRTWLLKQRSLQGCQMVYFQNKLSVLVHFGSPFNGKFWYILRLFGILGGHLLYFMVISYMLWQFDIYYPHLGTLYKEKSGDPCSLRLSFCCSISDDQDVEKRVSCNAIVCQKRLGILLWLLNTKTLPDLWPC